MLENISPKNSPASRRTQAKSPLGQTNANNLAMEHISPAAVKAATGAPAGSPDENAPQPSGWGGGAMNALSSAGGAAYGLFSKMAGAPPPPKALSEGDVSPGMCHVEDNTLSAAVSGVETAFNLIACDSKGVQVGMSVVSGSSGFEVKFSGPGNIKPLLERNGEGELLGRFTPIAAGSYTVLATYKGQHIKGSPGNLIVTPGPASGARSVLHAPSSLQAGRKAENMVAVICHDQNGNVTRGGDNVVMELDCGNQGISSIPVSDQGNGTYNGHITVEKAGLCTLTVHVNGELIGVPTTLAVTPGEPVQVATCSGNKLVCTAGEPARFVVQATDASGNNLARGGFKVKCSISCTPTDEAKRMNIDTEVSDNGNGTFTVAYSVPRVGEFTAHAQVVGGSHVLTLSGNCLPSRTSSRHCRVLETKERIVAGQSGLIRIQRMDALGNMILSGVREVPFVARGEGPGPMTVDVADLEGGIVEVSYEARVAGTYTLTVVDAISGTPIPGLPMDVEVRAGPVASASCVASVSGAEEGPAGFELTAGGEAFVHVKARDIYGNTAAWRERHKLEVVATGPQTVAFSQLSRSDDTAVFNGVISTSGSYTLSVGVGGLSGPSVVSPATDSRWAKSIGGGSPGGPAAAQAKTPVAKKAAGPPKTPGSIKKTPAKTPSRTPSTRKPKNAPDVGVPVPEFDGAFIISPSKLSKDTSSVPGGRACCRTLPSRTTAAGPALGALTCWEPATFVISTMDEFGNHRVAGGDEVVARALPVGGPEGRELVQAHVSDNGNGSYTASIRVDAKGEWQVEVDVNGEPLEPLTATVTATYGPVTAKDCRLIKPESLVGLCGESVQVAVEPLEKAAGRCMTGLEAVSVKVVTPSGSSRRTAAALTEDRTGYTASLPLLEAGTHTVHVFLGKDEVDGSGFIVKVTPLDASLEQCEVRGSGLETCVAGEPAEFFIKTCDERGNRLETGGAHIVFSVRCGAELVPGSLHDLGDGNYKGTYTITAAGLYDLVVSLGDKSNVYHGVCHPSAPVTERCEVEEVATALTAGSAGLMRVRLADQYGNIHESACGAVPFEPIVDGPGVISIKAVECADGTVAVQYEAEHAGTYTIALEDRQSETQVPGGPWKVEVAAGLMVASACLARVDINGELEKTTSPVGSPGAAKADVDSARIPRAVVAGDDVLVHVEARDKFGNATSLMDGQRFWVEARGPQEIIFEDVDPAPVSTPDKAEGAPKCTFRGTVTAAGSYVLSVAVGTGAQGVIAPGRATTPSRSTTPTTPRRGGTTSRPTTPSRSPRGAEPTSPSRSGTTSRPTTPGRAGTTSRPTTPGRAPRTAEPTTPGRAGTTSRPTTPGRERSTTPGRVSISTRPTTPSRSTTPTRRSLPMGGDAPAPEPKKKRPTALKAVKGWPRVLQCVAGPSDGALCTVHGDALAGVTCWDSHDIVVSTADCYGNPRVEGGDTIGVKMQGPFENAHGTGSVTDNLDGTYTLSFTVGEPGEWWLNVTVNGAEVLGDEGKCIKAKFGPIQAKDCEMMHQEEDPACGDTTTLTILPRERELGRRFTGREGCTVKVVTPAGISRRVSAKMAEKGENKGRQYRSQLTWLEAGKHTVWVALGETQVPGSPFTVMAHAQAADLQMCEVQGPRLTSCTAGETAAFLIQARDGLGNVIQTGGAPFALAAKPLARGGVPSQGEIQDRGDGSYVASYSVDKAGKYELELSLGSSTCVYTGQCLPSGAYGPNCSILSSEMECVAGTAGVIRVQQIDRLGNKLTISTGDVPLQAEGSGPGPLAVRVVEVGDGTVNIEYKSHVAGTYDVVVKDSALGDPLQGSPIQVTVLAGPMAVESCMATVEGLEGGTRGRAGEDVIVKVEARDKYGNATGDMCGQVFWVEAAGPAGVVFEDVPEPAMDKEARAAAAAADPARRGRATFKGELKAAGTYMLSVGAGERGAPGSPGAYSVMSGMTARSRGSAVSRGTSASRGSAATSASRASSQGSSGSMGAYSVASGRSGMSGRSSLTSNSLRRRDGKKAKRTKPPALKSLASWPRRVQIMASTADTKKCTFHGDSLSGVTCWDPINLTIHTIDRFDNARSVGGDKVVVSAVGPAGPDAAVEGRVEDHGNGTYGVDLTLTAPGKWAVSATINGEKLGSDKGLALTAESGRMRAGDCVVGHTAAEDAVCGSTTMLTIAPREAGRAGRSMSGNEAISVRVEPPSGTSRRINALLDRTKDTYHAKLRWVESGEHKVFVQFGGEPLPGSPLVVRCAPSEIAALACDVSGRRGEVGAIARVGGPVEFQVVELEEDELAVACDPPGALGEAEVAVVPGGGMQVSMSAMRVCTASVSFSVSGGDFHAEAAVEVLP